MRIDAVECPVWVETGQWLLVDGYGSTGHVSVGCPKLNKSSPPCSRGLARRTGMANETHRGAFRCIRVQTVGAVNGRPPTAAAFREPGFRSIVISAGCWPFRGIESGPSHGGPVRRAV